MRHGLIMIYMIGFIPRKDIDRCRESISGQQRFRFRTLCQFTV